MLAIRCVIWTHVLVLNPFDCRLPQEMLPVVAETKAPCYPCLKHGVSIEKKTPFPLNKIISRRNHFNLPDIFSFTFANVSAELSVFLCATYYSSIYELSSLPK